MLVVVQDGDFEVLLLEGSKICFVISPTETAFVIVSFDSHDLLGLEGEAFAAAVQEAAWP